MKTLKKLWARFLRYLDEVNARDHEFDDVPTRKQVKEHIAALRRHREDVRAAARRAGVPQ